MLASRQERQRLERRPRDELESYQLHTLNALLARILPHNAFYQCKLQEVKLPLQSLDDLRQLPLTTKPELLTDDPGGFAANRTYPLSAYQRYHRTSGTSGRPLVVLDTAEDWRWWMECWQFVLDAAEISEHDRVFMAFSFGPFIGFWSAYDACLARGALVVPTGGISTVARLDLLQSSQATCLFCTPSYALHLAEVAEREGLDLSRTAVRAIVVAGEPGGSVPSIRQRIQSSWRADVIDHSGASEVGPWGFGMKSGEGLFVNEHDFIAEFLDLESGQPAGEDQLAELVLTTLGREGSPVIRYRTGDLVRPRYRHRGDTQFVLLQQGVLGRVDDMMIIRGVNVFPSSIEAILREFPEISEYRLTARREGAMDELLIEIEDAQQSPQRVVVALERRLGLRVEVRCVAAGALPRFEAKGRRFVDQRQ